MPPFSAAEESAGETQSSHQSTEQRKHMMCIDDVQPFMIFPGTQARTSESET